MALLVDLDKFKLAIGETTNDNDDKWLDALEDASSAVLNYTDRDFGVDEIDEDRTYTYNGRGLLEIDDASAIDSVEMNGTVLAETTYVLGMEGPTSAAVYTYIELPSFMTLDGEMGFTYNLDMWLAIHGRTPVRVPVVVNGTWGWPVVPDDVQRATIITAASLASDLTTAFSQGLQSRSVAEVSESYALQAAVQAQTLDGEDPLPIRARQLLAPYRRMTMP